VKIALIILAVFAVCVIAKPPPRTQSHLLEWDWPGGQVWFLLETKADKQAWVQIAKTTNQSFKFTNISMNTLTQYYRVRATDLVVTSEWSNIATGIVKKLWVNH
jgi:hypothetical protein